jgi:hypothetical protein
LEKFNLKVAEEKTGIIPFARNSGSKETFDFLGFTHINGKTRKGYYRVVHRTSQKKMNAKRQEIKLWLMMNMHKPVGELIIGLNRRLSGHYHGISGDASSDCYRYPMATPGIYVNIWY